MPRIASLGMYDSGAAQGANDRLWAAIARRLRAAGLDDVPDRLDRSRSLEAIWDDPSLLLAQTCGYPLVTRWKGRLRYVATPRYRAAGCEGATHRSRVIVRADDRSAALEAFRGRAVAVNDLASNTGMNLLRALIAPLALDGRFFGAVKETGSHGESVRAVGSGDADLAAIDAVTFAHLERDEPESVRRVRALTWTGASPALPFVTSMTTPRATVLLLREALRQSIADGAEGGADTLLLSGIAVVPGRAYRRLRAVERRAVRAGYPHLA